MVSRVCNIEGRMAVGKTSYLLSMTF